jgi:hypothetical protein
MGHSSPRSDPYAEHDLVMYRFMVKAGMQGVLIHVLARH